MRRVPLKQFNHHVRRERDRRAFSQLLGLLGCGALLAGGFIYAAQQHFIAVDYGYKNEELRREQRRLLEEQRRLLLTREQAVTPDQLERAARTLGLKPVSPAQLAAPRPDQASATHPGPALTAPTASLP
jgi:hypothetical protein